MHGAGGGGGGGGGSWVTKLYACTPFIIGSRNVVFVDVGFSIPNRVFLAKSPHCLSSSCCTRTVGIAHEPVRSA